MTDNEDTGSGSGYGDGSGYGSGDGYGDGSGYGSGSGYGDGSGYGSGYGSGDGSGSGYGDGDGIDWEKTTAVHRGSRSAGRGAIADGYGHEAGNIGADTGETFWSAARVIVEQTYAVLRPGGYAAWVTKRFVRNKQIVEFSEQWAQLCEAVGFVRVEWIRAMLTEEHDHQLDIFGDSHPKGIKRASFFRRLYERKYPENAIDWEDVLIMRRRND